MKVVDKLKLNKFRDVAIPSIKDMFARYGYAVPHSQSYTGDSSDSVVMSKLDAIHAGDMYDRYRSELENVPPAHDPNTDVVDTLSV